MKIQFVLTLLFNICSASAPTSTPGLVDLQFKTFVPYHFFISSLTFFYYIFITYVGLKQRQ